MPADQEEQDFSEFDDDNVLSITMDELYEIGIGQRACDDDKLRIAAQTHVAVTFRQQGYTYRVIASEMGIHLSRAHDLVQKAMKRLREKTKDTAETVRDINIERLNELLTFYWGPASKGLPEAGKMALQIIDRIDRAYGIEPPKRIEHSFTDEDVNAARQQLFKALTARNTAGTPAGDSGDTA